MNLKKQLMLSLLGISLATSQVLANEDFVIPEESIEVVDSKEVASNFDSTNEQAQEIEAASNETLGIETETVEKKADFEKVESDSKIEESNPYAKAMSQGVKPGAVARSSFKAKDYTNIRYHKDFEWFSIVKHDESEFKSFLKYMNLPKNTIKNMYGKVDTPDMVRLNAYAYDYGYGKPNIAENYYLKFPESDIGFYDKKIRYADFLIRTGRPNEVENVLKKEIVQ